MFKQLVIATVIGSMLVAGTAPAWATTPTQQVRQADIPFADHGGIRDWRADGDRALYIQGSNGQWYHATLMSPSIGLNFAEGIGFVSEPTGDFDHFSSILVGGQSYPLTSLVTSDAPPVHGH